MNRLIHQQITEAKGGGGGGTSTATVAPPAAPADATR